MNGSLARRLAWLAIAAQAAFVVAWIVAGALDPGYSHADQGVSSLGAKDAENAWILRTALVMLGASVAILGPALTAVLPRRRSRTVAVALFLAAGAALAVAGLAPVDCSFSTEVCRDRFDAGQLSASTDVHIWASLAFNVTFVGTTFALARALWPSPVAGLSLGAGLFGIAFVAATTLLTEAADAPDGLVQRLGWLTTHAWIVIVAGGILHSLPRRARAGTFVPLRPREFFGRAWAGDGEVVFRPELFWGRFPFRVHFTREARWLSDEAWVMDDTTTFATGYAIERRMYLVMDESAERVHVAADDMPGGAELILDEGGYRVRPYKYAFPVGPLRLTLTCHDRVHANGDGSLDWTIAFRWHGIPAGRISGRVRPVEAG